MSEFRSFETLESRGSSNRNNGNNHALSTHAIFRATHAAPACNRVQSVRRACSFFNVPAGRVVDVHAQSPPVSLSASFLCLPLPLFLPLPPAVPSVRQKIIISSMIQKRTLQLFIILVNVKLCGVMDVFFPLSLIRRSQRRTTREGEKDHEKD